MASQAEALKDDKKKVELATVRLLDRYPAGWDYETDRLDENKRVIIFGNDAGGVGKSLCAEYAAILFEELRIDFNFIECETGQRISQRFPDKALYHEYDKEEQDVDPDAAGVYWDALAIQLTRSPNAIVDMSANAIKNFSRWASTGSGGVYLRRGAGITFVCCMTTEPKALAHARINLLSMKAAFPDARLILLLNPVHGPLRSTDPRVELLQLETQASVFSMPYNAAPAWGMMQGLGRYDEVAALSIEDLIRRGIDGGKAARSVTIFRQFSSQMSDLLRQIAGLPSKDRPAESALKGRSV